MTYIFFYVVDINKDKVKDFAVKRFHCGQVSPYEVKVCLINKECITHSLLIKRTLTSYGATWPQRNRL